jgi:hypothetical protein
MQSCSRVSARYRTSSGTVDPRINDVRVLPQVSLHNGYIYHAASLEHQAFRMKLLMTLIP